MDNKETAIKVSIVVPCCNVEKYLDKCLSSIIDQTLNEIEIICINDGSTDGTLDIIRYYGARDSRIVVLDKENSGYGDSMNKGFAMAKGEYIGIVESDDFIDPDMFRALYETAIENDADVVKSNFSFYWGESDKNELHEYFRKEECGRIICPRVYDNGSLFTRKPSIWSSIYKADFIRKNNIGFLPSPGASYQDTAFIFKVYSTANVMVAVYDAYLHYRQDNAGSSVNNAHKKMHCIADEYGEIREFLNKGNCDREALYPIYATAYYDACIWMYELLAHKYRREFLFIMSRQMKQLLSEINVKRIGFGGCWWKFRDIVRIANDPVEYHIWRDVERYEQIGNTFEYKDTTTPNNNIEQVIEAQNNKAEKPLFSVIIPVYNNEKYIAACLDSLLLNEYKNAEFICINDGSEDHSLNILEYFAENDDRVVIINQDNAGQSAAKNAGIKAAQGKYIMFLDGDDYYNPGIFERLEKEISRNDDVIIYGGKVSPQSANTGWYERVLKTDDRYYEKVSDKELFSIPYLRVYSVRSCLKRSFVEEKGLLFDPDAKYGEDAIFMIQLLLSATGVSVISDIMYNYRVNNPASLMNSLFSDKGNFAIQQQIILEKIVDILRRLDIKSSKEFIEFACDFVFASIDNAPEPARTESILKLVDTLSNFGYEAFVDELSDNCRGFWEYCLSVATEKTPEENKTAEENSPEVQQSAEEKPVIIQKKDEEKKISLEKETKTMDKKHYDVGIVGWWFASNYGSALTYYALGKILEEKGLSSVMLSVSKLNRTPWEPTTKKARDFISKYFPTTPEIPYERNTEYNDLCDAFMLGSDQLWTKWACEFLGYTFFLDFAEPTKRKIAYATSLGKAGIDVGEKDKKAIHSLLSTFDYISVREESGIRVCKDAFNIDVKRDLDPVFLCDRKHYDALADSCEGLEPDDNFVFSYILDVNEEKQKAVQYAADKIGARVISVLDIKLVDRQKDNWHVGTLKPDCSIEEFIYYIKHCKLMVTDSHHGACFAMLFHRNFITIANAGRGLTRFTNLFNIFRLNDKLLAEPEEIYKKKNIFDPINYDKFEEILAKEKANSFERFNNALTCDISYKEDLFVNENDKRKRIMNSVAESFPGCIVGHLRYDQCMGCGACVSTCPVDALSLKPDGYGYYRATLDNSKCINCGKCTKVCPSYNISEKTNSENPELYVFSAKSNDLLAKSSSGGVFSLLAQQILDKNGVVVGAAWSEDYMSVSHIMVDNKNDLEKLRKSKYLQSYMGDTFRKVKEKLDKGTPVLFSGCSCQAAGLRSYLGRDYDNLYVVDILCANAPSQKYFEEYIKDSFPEGIKKYEFRDKTANWQVSCNCVAVTRKNGKTEHFNGGGQDKYQWMFHPHIMCAPHCENCKYQSIPRYGDITLGDFWGIDKKIKEYDFTKGASAVLCNNEKGKALFEGISDKDIGFKKKTPLEWLGGNGYAVMGHNSASPYRDAFAEAIKKGKSFTEATEDAMNSRYIDARNKFYKTLSPLQFDSKQQLFNVNYEDWSQSIVDGRILLIPKDTFPLGGKFASLPLNKRLEKGKRYRIYLRFKVKTNSKLVNFHLKQSNTSFFRIIQSYTVRPIDNQEWVNLSFEYVPQFDVFDEFMIGAAQTNGNGRFILFDSIYITEVDE